MSGLKSRNKGRREEQQLVLALAKLGYQAERILRQYQYSGQPDVRASKDGKEYTFEMKSRKESFKTLYELYYQEMDGDKVLKFVLSSNGIAVAVSTDFNAVLSATTHFRNLALFPAEKKKLKAYERFVKLKELKQSADFLVIKDNNMPRLFIKYWN